MTKLRLIDSSAGAPPPRPLGKHGVALWRSISTDYAIDDACGVELLCLACQALDRAEACREVIDHVGEGSITESGIVRANPMLRDELANRSFVAKTLERLGVNQEPKQAVGRPPGSYDFEPKTKDAAS